MQEFSASVSQRTDDEGKQLVDVDLGNPRFHSEEWTGTDADLKLLNEVAALGELEVDIDLEFVSPSAFSAIEFAQPLRTLTLVNPTDKSVDELTSLPKMRKLSLRDSRLTPIGCRRLVTLAAGATELALWQSEPRGAAPGIGDAELAELARLKNIESLHMSGGTVSDAGLAHLTKMKKIETLSMWECPKLRASDLAPLSELEQLRSLHFSFRVSAAAVATIGKLDALEELTLSLVHLKPADVAPLAGLKHVCTLTIESAPDLPWERDDNRPKMQLRRRAAGRCDCPGRRPDA